MRELGRVEGTPGKDLELTIDLALQNYAMRRMAGESAAAAVIDVTNGDILALASAPGFERQQLRLRHQVGRVERAPQRRVPPAQQQDDHRHLPARLDLQDLHGARRARGGRGQPRRRGLLRRLDGARRPALPLLEARRPRARRPPPQPLAVLRLLLLRDGPPARPRPDQRHGAQARARRRATTCRSRRSRPATCPTPPGRRPSARSPGPPATASTTASARASPSPRRCSSR